MKRALLILALVLVVALPFLLRPEKSAIGKADGSVVIITPHVDAIRHEFGNGFRRWHTEKFSEPAEVEWRVLGGTSDALRFVLSEFSRKPDSIGLDIFFGGGQEPGHRAQRRGLSCAVGAHQRYDLARLDPQRDVVHDLDIAVGDGDATHLKQGGTPRRGTPR